MIRGVAGKDEIYQINKKYLYEIDLEKNIVVITYRGEFKEYSYFIEVRAGNLREKDQCPSKREKFLYWIGILMLLFVGPLIAEKYPISLVPLLLIGIYSTMKLNYTEEISCAIRYLEKTKCEKCGKNFAYQEIRKPSVREISTPKSYEICITRNFKCKYCGYIHTEKRSEGYSTCKRMNYNILQETLGTKPECRKCGRGNAYNEFRKSDTKSKNNIMTEIKYYKCRYCGNIEVKVEEGLVPPNFSAG